MTTTKSRSKKPFTSTTIKKHYKLPDDISSLSARGAHFFAWAAENYPKQFISWVLVYRAVTQLWRASERSKEVELFRARGSAIRRILIDIYGREFTTSKGLGGRATVGDEDTLKTEGVKKARKLQSAATAAIRTVGLINPAKIKDPQWRKWLSRSLRGVVKEISSPEFEAKLLPPGTDKNDKDDNNE